MYSTSSEVIEELAATTDIPFLQDFGNLQAIVKDLGTYYIVEEFDEEGALTKGEGDADSGAAGQHRPPLNMTSTVTAFSPLTLTRGTCLAVMTTRQRAAIPAR